MVSAGARAADEHYVLSNPFLLCGVPGDDGTIGISHYGALGLRIASTERALKPGEFLTGSACGSGVNRTGQGGWRLVAQPHHRRSAAGLSKIATAVHRALPGFWIGGVNSFHEGGKRCRRSPKAAGVHHGYEPSFTSF